jgi:hypothetical protein
MGTRRIDGPVLPDPVPPVTKTSPVTQLPVFNEIPQQTQPVRIPAPLQQKSDIGRGIALLVPGCLIILAGFFYASSSKSAGNFETFYQQMVTGNILVTVGVVMLYNALGIFGSSLAGFIRSRRSNL